METAEHEHLFVSSLEIPLSFHLRHWLLTIFCIVGLNQSCNLQYLPSCVLQHWVAGCVTFTCTLYPWKHCEQEADIWLAQVSRTSEKSFSVLTELMQVSGLTFYHVNRTTCNSKKASSRFPWVRGQLNCHIRARGGKRSRNRASTELLAEGPIGDPDVVSTMNFKRIEYQCDCLSIFWLQFPGLQHLHANRKYERWHNKFTVPN